MVGMAPQPQWLVHRCAPIARWCLLSPPLARSMGIHGVVAVAVGGLLALASVEVEGPEPGGCEAHGDFASLLQVTKPDSVSDIAARLRAMPGYLPVTTPEDAERFRQIGVECHLQDRGGGAYERHGKARPHPRALRVSAGFAHMCRV